MSKRYIVYIEVPDDNVSLIYGYRRFKITAWLLAKYIKHTFYDDLFTVIYDRKKGDVIYEK